MVSFFILYCKICFFVGDNCFRFIFVIVVESRDYSISNYDDVVNYDGGFMVE